MGMWYEWWVKGPVCPGPFQTSGGGEKNARGGKDDARQSAGCCTSMCSWGVSWDFTRGHRRWAEAGLEKESTGWFERSIRRGMGAARELPAFVSRDAVTQSSDGLCWVPVFASPHGIVPSQNLPKNQVSLPFKAHAFLFVISTCDMNIRGQHVIHVHVLKPMGTFPRIEKGILNVIA